MRGESGNEEVKGDADDRFVSWKNIYDADMEGHGVSSNAHEHGDEGYSNMVGDDRGGEQGELVNVQNDDAIEDDADEIYSNDGFHSVHSSDFEIQVVVMQMVWRVMWVLCTQWALKI